MKKLIPLLNLYLFCLAASAQPTSFGGITPGQTTWKELRFLVNDSLNMNTSNDFFVHMSQPEGMPVRVKLQNDVVYSVSLDLNNSPELKQALVEKYGQPKYRFGAIRTITCQNKLGGSFERFEGVERLDWPVNKGVQGAILRGAVTNCAETISEAYTLVHLATEKAIKDNNAEQERKEAEDKRRKLGDAF